METIILTCKECGKEFQLSPGEQTFYSSNNLQLPKRCKDCREKRKEQKAEQERIKRSEADEKVLQDLLGSSRYRQ